MKVEAGWGDQDSLKDLLDPFQGILGPGALNQNSSAVSRRSEKGKQNRRGLSLSMQAHDLLRLRVLPGLKWWILALHAALASLHTGRAASEQVWAAAGRLGRKGSLPARVSGSECICLPADNAILANRHFFFGKKRTPLYVGKTVALKAIFFSILLSWWFSRCSTFFFSRRKPST